MFIKNFSFFIFPPLSITEKPEISRMGWSSGPTLLMLCQNRKIKTDKALDSVKERERRWWLVPPTPLLHSLLQTSMPISPLQIQYQNQPLFLSPSPHGEQQQQGTNFTSSSLLTWSFIISVLFFLCSLRILSTPISAVNSGYSELYYLLLSIYVYKLILCSCFSILGLEASITDSNDISVFLTDATVLVQEPRDEDKIQVSHNIHQELTPI